MHDEIRSQPSNNLPPAPARAVSARAPSGPVGSSADCCPKAVIFSRWAFRGDPATIFGYDDTTNRPEQVADVYWQAGNNETTPQDKATRDGARWISVPKGEQVEIEVAFVPSDECARKCSYEFDPGGVAKIVGRKPQETTDLLTIEGIGPGETTLRVMCGGKPRGHLYIWCQQMATIQVGIGALVVESGFERDAQGKALTTEAASYSIPDIVKVFDKVFRQALLRIEVTDLGTLDLNHIPGGESVDGVPSFEWSSAQAKSSAFDSSSAIFDDTGMPKISFATADDFDFEGYGLSIRGLTGLANRVSGTTAPYNLWFACTQASRAGRTGGVADGVPGKNALIFVDALMVELNPLPNYEYCTAHELAHLLGLFHVSDAEAASQLPPHLRDGTHSGMLSVDPDDGQNLMSVSDKTPYILRYGQWRALQRK